MSAAKTMVVSALGTAAAGAGMWWMVNRTMRINDVGWLERLGWPYDSPILVAVIGAAIGFIRGYFRHRRQVSLQTELAVLSDEVGLELEKAPGEFEQPAMPLFENMRSIENRLTGEKNGVPVDVFDLTTVVKSDDGDSRTTRTVLLMPAEGLPNFRLNAKTLGYRFLGWVGACGVTFDPAAAPTPEDREAVVRFAKLYLLNTGDTTELSAGTPEVFAEADNAARQVFTLGVLRLFAEQPGWSVESHGERLAFWRGNNVLTATERLVMLDAALVFRHALLQPEPKVVLPPQPGTERERQSARFQGTLLGGVIGLFGSFFLAAIVTMSALFSRKPGEIKGFPFDLLLFPAILVVGTLLGILIGSRLPVHKPWLQKPKDKRHERRVGCAVLFGLFAGFLGGAMFGGILGEMLNLKFEDHTTRIALFFGGAGVGAITGPIIFGYLASRLFRARSSEELPTDAEARK